MQTSSVSTCFPQPDLIIGCLAVLPSVLTCLEIDSLATGPLPAALQRFTALRSLSLPGDTAGVDWDSGAAAAAVAPLLQRLRMSCVKPEFQIGSDNAEDFCVPQAAVRFFSAGTPLHSLDIEAGWSPELAQLFRSLPALQELR